MRNPRFGMIAIALAASLTLIGCGGGGGGTSGSGGTSPDAPAPGETGGISGGGVFLESSFEQPNGTEGLQASDIRKVFTGIDLCMVPGSARGAVLSTDGGASSAIVYFSRSTVPPAGFDFPVAYLIEGVEVVPDGENNEGWLRGQYSADFRTEKDGITSTIPLTGYILVDPNSDDNGRMYISCASSNFADGDKGHRLFADPTPEMGGGGFEADTWRGMAAAVADVHLSALSTFNADVSSLRLSRDNDLITADQYLASYTNAVETYRLTIDTGIRAAFADNEPEFPELETLQTLSYYDAAQQLVYWVGQSDLDTALRSDYLAEQIGLGSPSAEADLSDAFTAVESAFDSMVTDFAAPPPPVEP